jgi:hypothetical protein
MMHWLTPQLDHVERFVNIVDKAAEGHSGLDAFLTKLLGCLGLYDSGERDHGISRKDPFKTQHLAAIGATRGPRGSSLPRNRQQILLSCDSEYSKAQRAIGTIEDYYGYYSDFQLKCCFVCQSRISDRMHFYFFPSRQDILWCSYKQFVRTAYERFFLPLLDPASQFLICAGCDRASRFRVEPVDGSAPHRRWWPSLDPALAFPFVTVADGTLSVTRNSPAEAANFWPMLVEFNLNRPALVAERKRVFIETQKDLQALISETEDAELRKLTRQVLTVNDAHALTRHSALLAFCRTKPLPRDDRRSNAMRLRQFVSASDLVDRIFNQTKSHADPDNALQQALEAALPRLGLPPDLAAPGRRDELAREFAGTFANVCRTLHREIEPRSTPPTMPRFRDRGPRFIKAFQITDYRGLRTERVEFPGHEETEIPVPDIAMLADNARGKTRILQALSLALMNPADVKSLCSPPPKTGNAILQQSIPGRDINGGPGAETDIKVWFYDQPDDEHLHVVFPSGFGLGNDHDKKKWRYVRHLVQGARTRGFKRRVPFIAFGSSRNPAEKCGRDIRGSVPDDPLLGCVRTLFRRDSHIPHPLWLNAIRHVPLNEEYRRAVELSLNDLVPDRERPLNQERQLTIEFRSNIADPAMTLNVGDAPYDSLSDGFRSVLGFGLYALYGLNAEQPLPAAGQRKPIKYRTSMSGIILVDEIDAHLHPSWRLRLVQDLRDFLPSVQFIFTTHDPLVLRGMPTKCVFRLEDPADAQAASGDKPAARAAAMVFRSLEEGSSLAGHEIDDLLVSTLFGLDSTRAPDDRDDFRRYLTLALQRAQQQPGQTGIQSTELRRLRDRFGYAKSGFMHPFDQIVIPAIEEIYAEYNTLPRDTRKRREAIDEVKGLLSRIWQQ